MKVGIIAAGEGSRLKQDGVSTLKPLVKVDGIAILERLLLQYHSINISEAYCIINEESLAVKEFIEHLKLPISVHFHVKTTPSSMHSLFELGQYLHNDYFLLSTVDSIFDTGELEGFMACAQMRDADGFLAVTQPSDDDNPLWVELGQSNEIMAFRRPTTAEALVTGGLYFFSPRVLDCQSEALSRNMSRLRNFLNLLLEKGCLLRGYKFNKIVDLDHAADIKLAEDFLRGLGHERSHA
jgi:NDP-sugar pyrophosphorylase family protein